MTVRRRVTLLQMDVVLVRTGGRGQVTQRWLGRDGSSNGHGRSILDAERPSRSSHGGCARLHVLLKAVILLMSSDKISTY